MSHRISTLKFSFFWVLCSIIGGAAATPLTILLFIILFNLFYRCIDQGMSLALCMSEPEKIISLADLARDAEFIRNLIFVGGVQAGILSLIQWLALFRQIPKTKQSLRASCMGAGIGFVLFGLMFNLANVPLFIDEASDWLRIKAQFGDSFIEAVILPLIFLTAAAMGGWIQGKVQSRMITGQRAGLLRWRVVSATGGAASMLLVLLSFRFFPIYL